MKDLKWEHEVLEQRFSKVQVERDDLYKKFTQAIQEVQQKSGFMNLLLERKLGALTNTLEKKEAQLNALVVVTRKLEEMASWNPKATDWSAPSLARPLTPPLIRGNSSNYQLLLRLGFLCQKRAYFYVLC